MDAPRHLKAFCPFQSSYLQLGDHRIHYVDEGEGDAVLMLHGNPTWSYLYRNVVAALRSKFRCIVPDHMGCGLSDKPQHYVYRLQTHIENALALVKALSLDRFHLVVHDWGGPIGFGLARQVPDLVHKLVVFNSSGFLSPRIPLRIRICRIPVFGPVAIRFLNGFAFGATRMAVAGKLPMEVRRGFLAPYDSWKSRIAILRFVQDIPLHPRHPSWKTMLKIESSLSTFRNRDMLLCWGLRDWCFTQHFLEGWKARFPDAAVHEFPNAGHYLLEDAGDVINPLVRRFLRSGA